MKALLFVEAGAAALGLFAAAYAWAGPDPSPRAAWAGLGFCLAALVAANLTAARLRRGKQGPPPRDPAP